MAGTGPRERPSIVKSRLGAMAVAVVALSAVLVLRLWQLQIVEGAVYASRAENNRLDYEVLKSPRGVIYGRDPSTVLADNRAACDLVMTPGFMRPDVDLLSKHLDSTARALRTDIKRLVVSADAIISHGAAVESFAYPSGMGESDREMTKSVLLALRNVRGTCDRLARLASVDANEQFARILDAIHRKVPFEQIVVKEDIGKTERMRVGEYSFALPGIYPVARPQRRYYHGETAGQLLGWINEISPEELERLRPRYKMGDIIGRDGIEYAYENQLKGTDGAMIVSRYNLSVPQLRTDERGNPYIDFDSKGRSLQMEERRDAVPGKPIFTTLDIDLQRECERILKDDLYAEDIVDTPAEGAIVVMNADTGELLALASVPTFDPNVFATASPDRVRIIGDLMDDPDKPMLHRAFQTHYSPGSVFKVLLAIAGLEEGVITEQTSFTCGGSFMLGGHTWRCWRHGGHGTVSVVDALAYSCDVFFYNVGNKLGSERLEKWATKLGVGVKTGVDLPREVPGSIANPKKKAAYAKSIGSKNPDDYKWYPGDTISMAIGQGMVDTTVLQNAVMMAAVVNGGKRVRPYINLELKPEVSEQLVKDATLRIVHDGMFKCVEKQQPPSGTGRLARIEGLEILGKTGTAQVVQMSQLKGRKEREVPYELRDHALFIAGVANMQPRIAISVIVEHGLHGSSTAAPVARKICEYYYQHKAKTDGAAAPVNVALREAGAE